MKTFLMLLIVMCLTASCGNAATTITGDIITKGPWMDARAFPTLADADAAAVVSGKQLVISSQWGTVPSTLSASILVLPGGKLNNSGALSINGSFDGSDGCFIGTGAVTGLKEARPEWWGIGGTGLIRAVAALSGKSTKLTLTSANYDIGATTLNVNGSMTVEGVAIANEGDLTSGSRIIYSGTGAALQVNDGTGITTHGVELKNLVISGSGSGIGVYLGTYTGSPKTGRGTIDRVFVTGFAEGLRVAVVSTMSINNSDFYSNVDGVVIVPGGGTYSTTTAFNSCRFSQNSRRGLRQLGGDLITFNRCTFELNGEEGVTIEKTAGITIILPVFNQCHFENNNRGRAGTGYYQFKAFSNDSSGITKATLNRCIFFGAGAGNYHFYLSGGTYSVEMNNYSTPSNGAMIGTIANSAAGTKVYMTEEGYTPINFTVESTSTLDVYSYEATGIKLYTSVGGTVSERFYMGSSGIRWSGTGQPYLSAVLLGSVVVDMPSIPNGSSYTFNVAVTGVALSTSFCLAEINTGLPSGVSMSANVTAAGTATVTVRNNSGSAYDAPSATVRVLAFNAS